MIEAVQKREFALRNRQQYNPKRQPTQRALDGGDSAAFSNIFPASSFVCFQELSTPTPPPVTRAVRRQLVRLLPTIEKMKDQNSVEAFWNAVIRQDYDTVRRAIANGFDVNTQIPGKVAPITFAQPAEDMVMLKLLWEAGANPATPWLEAVFTDFANGGDGSAFKSKKLKAVGSLTLHRYNGDEIYKIENAVIRLEKIGGKTWLSLEIATNGTIEKSLPDTVDLHAAPSAHIAIPVEELEESNLVGKSFSLPNSYDEVTNDYLATIYYVEHESIESNEIEIVSRKKNKFLVKWSGLTQDVNYYDGSKPNTHVEMEGWFSLQAKDSQ